MTTDVPVVPPWVPFSFRDWRDGTRRLTHEEKGAYMDLLAEIYDSGDQLRDNDARVARGISMSQQRYRKVKATLIAEGKIAAEGGFIRNRRATAELDEYRAKIAAKSRAGKASAESKKANRFNGRGSTDTQQNPNTSATEATTDAQQDPDTAEWPERDGDPSEKLGKNHSHRSHVEENSRDGFRPENATKSKADLQQTFNTTPNTTSTKGGVDKKTLRESEDRSDRGESRTPRAREALRPRDGDLLCSAGEAITAQHVVDRFDAIRVEVWPFCRTTRQRRPTDLGVAAKWLDLLPGQPLATFDEIFRAEMTRLRKKGLRPPGTLQFIDDDVRDAIARQRKRLDSEDRDRIDPEVAGHRFSHWVMIYKLWLTRGVWDLDAGPRPDGPQCRCPPEAIERAIAETPRERWCSQATFAMTRHDARQEAHA